MPSRSPGCSCRAACSSPATRNGLRDWAKKTGLKDLPADVQDHFLYGLPGVVFDASNKDGKFVLVSEDGGSCSVVAEIASGPGVITDLEQDLNDAKITFKVTGEKARCAGEVAAAPRIHGHHRASASGCCWSAP